MKISADVSCAHRDMAIGINFYVYVTTLEPIAYHFTMYGAFWQESAISMLRIVETTTNQRPAGRYQLRQYAWAWACVTVAYRLIRRGQDRSVWVPVRTPAMLSRVS
ncbi:MAG: hypothetical protein KAS54_02095 [Dehalococcoidia bacterium]|nr:hypothetical protein [Dehalococcoidia bacterium]